MLQFSRSSSQSPTHRQSCPAQSGFTLLPILAPNNQVTVSICRTAFYRGLNPSSQKHCQAQLSSENVVRAKLSLKGLNSLLTSADASGASFFPTSTVSAFVVSNTYCTESKRPATRIAPSKAVVTQRAKSDCVRIAASNRTNNKACCKGQKSAEERTAWEQDPQTQATVIGKSTR